MSIDNNQSNLKTEHAIRNSLASSQHARYTDRPEVDEASYDEKFICNGHANEILPGLYLGDITAASELMKDELEKLHITGIVKCTMDSNIDFFHQDIEYIRVAIHDSEIAQIGIYLSGCCDFINRHINNSGSVLVHCQRGVSRSASIVIAYLIKYHKMTLENAFIHTKQRRILTSPNIGFWKELMAFVNECENGVPTVNGEASEEDVTFDEPWCRKACAEFHIYGEANIANRISSLTTTIEQQQALLYGSLDFVFGRCMVNSDIIWLKFICHTLDFNTSITYLHNLMLIDSSGEFIDSWGSEYSRSKLRSLLVDLGADESSSLFMNAISEESEDVIEEE